MGLHTEPDAKIIFEGEGIIAVHQNGRVEVWFDDYEEEKFRLWPDATVEEVKIINAIFEKALKRGVEQGKREKIWEIKNLVASIFGK